MNTDGLQKIALQKTRMATSLCLPYGDPSDREAKQQKAPLTILLPSTFLLHFLPAPIPIQGHVPALSESS